MSQPFPGSQPSNRPNLQKSADFVELTTVRRGQSWPVAKARTAAELRHFGRLDGLKGGKIQCPTRAAAAGWPSPPPHVHVRREAAGERRKRTPLFQYFHAFFRDRQSATGGHKLG